MESLALLPPSINIRLFSSSSTRVCLKVFSSHNRRASTHQCVDTLSHQGWLKRLDSFAIQPFGRVAVSWKLCPATLAGDVVVEECPTNRGECGEGAQISEGENMKIQPNLKATKPGQEQQVGKRDAPWTSKRIRVGLDALKPGAVLTGKVTNIEKFGAFVDVGAFSSGLIHISNLSKNFVSSVEDIVKVGEEVQVEVVNVIMNSRRISLKLIRDEEEPKVEQNIPLPNRNGQFIPKKSSSNSAVARPQKGEVITGSVTRIVSTGVFVTLKQGHQGFLPASEVLSNGGTVETTSFFRLGQQMPVRVLRTTKDRITLTMKKQLNANENRAAVISSPEDRATSPFEIAFRRDKDISRFLEERERVQKISNGNVDESAVVELGTEMQQS